MQLLPQRSQTQTICRAQWETGLQRAELHGKNIRISIFQGEKRVFYWFALIGNWLTVSFLFFPLILFSWSQSLRLDDISRVSVSLPTDITQRKCECFCVKWRKLYTDVSDDQDTGDKLPRCWPSHVTIIIISCVSSDWCRLVRKSQAVQLELLLQ